MTYLRFALLPRLVLVACKAPAPQPVIQRVEVPVAVPCPAPPPRRPLVLPISALPPDASQALKAQALKATFLVILGRYDEAEALLDGYRPQASK